MKKVLLLMCLLMAGQMVSAQSFDSIFDECKEKGAMNLNMTKDMIKMAMALQKNQPQSNTAILEKIDNMKMAVLPSPDSLFVEKIIKELEALEKKENDASETVKSDGNRASETVSSDGYTKVMMGEEKDKNSSVLILLKAEGEDTIAPIVREFVIGAVTKEKGQQVMLVAQILGRFNVDDLEALMRIAKRR